MRREARGHLIFMCIIHYVTLNQIFEIVCWGVTGIEFPVAVTGVEFPVAVTGVQFLVTVTGVEFPCLCNRCQFPVLLLMLSFLSL